MSIAYASLAEAAEFWGVDPKTVRNWVARGAITAFRVPGSRLLRFRWSDLEALAQPVPTVGGAR